MAKAAERIMNVLERVEKIPWYWVGLFTAVALLIISLSLKKTSNSHIFFYGGEYGAVGAALAQGRGFSDPFLSGTGATAWVAPLLPAIMGAIFYITSFKIAVTYWVVVCIKILSLAFGAGLIWAVLQKGNRGFAAVCYLWMGILCYVYKIELISLHHDEWLIFLVISLAFWTWHHRAEFSGRIGLIVAFSAAALCNPILWGALLTVMLVPPRQACEDADDSGEGRLNKGKPVFAQHSFWMAIGVSFVLIVGWTARNWIQVGMFAPIKSNAGYEIYQAQIASRTGVPDFSTFAKHPIIFTSKDNHEYGALGEARFIRTRRDMAIRSIWADPPSFCRKLAHRFTNAFLFTASPLNTALVDATIGSGDLERLRKAGFIAYRNNQILWIDLDDPDRDLVRALPSLGLDDPQSVRDNWRSMSEGHHWYRFSWDRIIGGCLSGGMPWVALLIAILLRKRVALTPSTRWAGLFLFVYLMPYVLISHYLRYQVPLLGMQAILLTAGTIAAVGTLRQPRFSTVHPEG